MVGAAAVLLPAGPAAALPSGAGWSASWSYYDPAAFEVDMTIPGGQIDGYATDGIGIDPDGLRRFNGTVQDTDARDRACVRMRVFATDTGSLGSATACNGGYEVVNTGEFTEALFVHIDLLVGGAITKSFFTFVPSSTNDPTLRTVGTGTSWEYTNASAFHVEVHRPGVQVIGDGTNQAAGRLVGAAVAHENAVDGCVLGGLADASTLVGDATCQVGDVPAFGDLFVGYLKVTGCYFPPSASARCLTMHVPEPQ
jgi:hypothetical protein